MKAAASSRLTAAPTATMAHSSTRQHTQPPCRLLLCLLHSVLILFQRILSMLTFPTRQRFVCREPGSQFHFGSRRLFPMPSLLRSTMETSETLATRFTSHQLAAGIFTVEPARSTQRQTKRTG